MDCCNTFRTVPENYNLYHHSGEKHFSFNGVCQKHYKKHFVKNHHKFSVFLVEIIMMVLVNLIFHVHKNAFCVHKSVLLNN